MRELRVIFLLLLPILLATTCSRVKASITPPEEQQTELGIYIQIPGVMGTKADEGEVPSKWVDEYAIHSLRFWIFKHDDTNPERTAFAYRNLSDIQLPEGGNVRYYSIPVNADFARERPSVDVFVLANSESVGCDFGENTTWEDLNDATFGGTYFGIPDSPQLSTSPSLPNGLPMSGVGKGLGLTGTTPALKIEETVKLVRAVSKLRFVFCKTKNEEGAADDIIINTIQVNGVDGYMIPKEEYVFPDPVIPWHIKGTGVSDYLAHSIIFSPALRPVENIEPEKLAYNNQDAATYEKLLDDAVEAGVLSDCGVFYTRESDKLLKVSITYRVNSAPEEQTKIFLMQAPPEGPYEEGDYARNHSWTVYGYFLSDRNMAISASLLSWDYNESSLINTDESYSVTERFNVVSPNSPTNPVVNSEGTNVYISPGTQAVATVTIPTPVKGKVIIQPVGDAWAFEVTPKTEDIPCMPLTIIIRRKDGVQYNPEEETFITLSFTIEFHDRETDINQEVFNGDVYRFIISE